MMVVFFLLTGGGALAAGLADGPTALMVGLAVLGLGAAIYHPVGLSWVVRSAVNRGRALGVLGIFGSVGVALAAVIAGGLMDLVDWRAAFLVPGAVCVATGLALLACLVSGLVVETRRDQVPQPAPSRGDTVRAFVVLSVTMVCAGLVFNATQIAMPKWFGERMDGLAGDGLLGIGGLVTIVYLFASGSQVVGGLLADRFALKPLYLVCLLVQVPLLVIAAGLSGLPLLAVATVMVFALGLQLPAENLLLARYTPDRHRGLAFGAKFILSFGIAPVGVQVVALSYGWTGDFTLLFVLLGVVMLVAFLAALRLPREGRARPDAVPAAPPAPAVAAGAE